MVREGQDALESESVEAAVAEPANPRSAIEKLLAKDSKGEGEKGPREMGETEVVTMLHAFEANRGAAQTPEAVAKLAIVANRLRNTDPQRYGVALSLEEADQATLLGLLQGAKAAGVQLEGDEATRLDEATRDLSDRMKKQEGAEGEDEEALAA